MLPYQTKVIKLIFRTYTHNIFYHFPVNKIEGRFFDKSYLNLLLPICAQVSKVVYF